MRGMAATHDAKEPENPWGQSCRLVNVALVLLIIYVLPLLAVAVDELVLGTYWIAKQFPDEARRVFFYVYPFLRFFYPAPA
jgi:hypothetical protein